MDHNNYRFKLGRKASDFVAAFVALSREGRAGAMWMELKKITMDMGNPSRSEVSAQDEAAMRLKPNKYFKRVLALMGNKDAVAGLLSLLTPNPIVPSELYNLNLGVILKLSSIPSFAKEFASAGAAAICLRFQQFHVSRIQAAVGRHTEWDPSYISTASRYTNLVRNLTRHSPQFAAEASESQLLHELLRFFPWTPQPSFPSWAADPDLKPAATLVYEQALTLLDLNPKTEGELPFPDVDLLGDWVERSIELLASVWEPLLALGEESLIVAASVDVLRVVERMEGLPGANQALFTPDKRREALLKAAGRIARLGGQNEALGREFAETIERATFALESDEIALKRWWGGIYSGERASIVRAEELLKGYKKAKDDAQRWNSLRLLQEELRKQGWGEQETRQLAAKGCFPLLLRVLEREDLRSGRKAGALSGTFQGPVCLALLALSALAEPFADLDRTGRKSFCRELGLAGPRLLRFANETKGLLGSLELRMLVEALFPAYEMIPDQKWEARWFLIDFLLEANQQLLPSGPGMWRVWHAFHFYMPLIPECSPGSVLFIAGLCAAPFDWPGKLEAWATLLERVEGDLATGDAYLGPDARKRKLATVALDVMERNKEQIAETNSPVLGAAHVLVWFCRFRSVIKEEVVGNVGPLMACLGNAYAGMVGLCGACEGRSLNEAEDIQWTEYEGTAYLLSYCLLAVLTLEPLEGTLLDGIARNGGVSFAAEVLRSRGGVEESIVRIVEESRDPTLVRNLLKDLHSLALRLWEGLSGGFGLKRCSFQDCKRAVLETQKNLFKKCAACSAVQYCSKECQTAHWKREHKKACRPIGST